MGIFHKYSYVKIENSNCKESIDTDKCILKNKTKEETLPELFNNIGDNIVKIEERIKYINQLQGSIDKSIDVQHHKLENLQVKDIFELSEKEKLNLLQIATTMQRFLQKRRKIKFEQTLSTTLLNNKFTEYSKLKKCIKNIKKQADNIVYNQEIKEKAYKEENLQNACNTIIRKNYASLTERMALTKELEKQYEKVSYDEESKEVIAYNKVYK